MKSTRILLLVVSLFAGYSRNAFCDYGTAGAAILNLEPSARIHSMAGAAAGLADDINAVYVNPAGLIQLYGMEFALTRLVYFEKTNMDTLIYAQKAGRFGFGGMLKLFRAQDEYRDEAGAGGKDFNIRFSEYRFSAGYQISGRHSAGLSFHMVTEDYLVGEASPAAENTGVSVFAADVGWLYRGRRGDSYGVVVRNMGPSYNMLDGDIRLPLKVVLGGGHLMGRFILSWEIYSSKQIDIGWKCGFQADINGFKFRSGIMYITKPDVVIGLGIPYRNWSVDYAFSPHQDLGIAHRVTLGAYF
jgi:long-subunit fatty acid transport protein